MLPCLRVAAFCILACLGQAGPANAQADKRRYQEPGLILETGGPTGMTDVLQFTPDGKYLMAAGDDKVVRLWPFVNGQLQAGALRSLRWPIYRQQRGSIYAAAYSNATGAPLLAVAGFGKRNAGVSVLDVATGEIKYGLGEHKEYTETNVLWAVAFSPDARQLVMGGETGNVWLWDLAAHQVRRLGAHPPRGAGLPNRVRLLAFTGPQTVLSIAQDGLALEWSIHQANQKPVQRFRIDLPNVWRVVASADGTRLAAIGEHGMKNNRAQVWTPDGQLVRNLLLANDEFPRAVALSADGSHLALGVVRRGPNHQPHQPFPQQLYLVPVAAGQPKPLSGYRSGYYMDRLAFHPDGRHLAIVGGDDFGISLLDVQRDRVVSEVESAGSALWGVRFSEDGNAIGYQPRRNANPSSFNDWGTGSWQVFDLRQGRFVSAAGFKPVPVLDELEGYKVFRPANVETHFHVQYPNRKSFLVPTNVNTDQVPRCWCFLKPVDGKPVRLAVGHYWGASIFELRPDGPVRVRRLIGHEGEVFSVAPSADHRALLTASRDQTIAAWSLHDWKVEGDQAVHRELGASFEVRQGQLVARSVAAGSPAWEAGVTSGQVIQLFAYDNRLLYDPQGIEKGSPLKRIASAKEAVEVLARAEAGKDCFFEFQDGTYWLTTVLQRPIWKFFPARDAEWVLYRWREYYYKTSTKGDSYIGWLVCGDMHETPRFYQAEQFRQRFHNPPKVDEVLGLLVKEPEKVSLPDLEPPQVTVEVVPRGGGVLSVTVTAMPRGESFFQQLESVSLWVNDHEVQSWKPKTRQFREVFQVPEAVLRAGPNLITAQAYNRAGVRENAFGNATISPSRPRAKPNLYVLAVGVKDYRRVAASSQDGKLGPLFPDLRYTVEDAEAIAKNFLRLRGTPSYGEVHVEILTDAAATRSAILAAVEKFGKQAQPDDLFMLFLSGHGFTPIDYTYVSVQRFEKLPYRFDSFVYITYDCNVAGERLYETGLTADVLFRTLARYACRKFLLVDACHSTQGADPIRGFTPEGVAPLLLTSCAPNESSWEVPEFGHGLFSQAILEATGRESAKADLNGDRVVDSDELFRYLAQRVPKMVEDRRPVLEPFGLKPGQTQTPSRFRPDPHDLPVPVAHR